MISPIPIKEVAERDLQSDDATTYEETIQCFIEERGVDAMKTHAGMHEIVSKILGSPYSWSYHFSLWATSVTCPRACIEVNEDTVVYNEGRERLFHLNPSAALVEYLALRIKEMMPDEP